MSLILSPSRSHTGALQRFAWLGVTSVVIVAGVVGFSALSRHALSSRSNRVLDAHSVNGHPGLGSQPTDSVSTRGYRQATQTLHAATSIDYTGDADVDFMRAMIMHQEAALAMAKVELEQGEDVQALAFAREVVRTHESELARMRDWLTARSDSASPVSIPRD